MVKPKRTTIVPGQTIVIKSGDGNLESGFDDSGFTGKTEAYCDSVTLHDTIITDVVFDWDTTNRCFSTRLEDYYTFNLYASGDVGLLTKSGRPNATVTIAPLEMDGDDTEVELRWVEW